MRGRRQERNNECGWGRAAERRLDRAGARGAGHANRVHRLAYVLSLGKIG